MGDPAGVGPEICLQLLANAEIAQICTPIIFGDALVLRQVADVLNWPLTATILGRETDYGQIDHPAIIDFGLITSEIEPGRIQAHCGNAAYQYVIAAIEAGLQGQIQAVTTAPLNKESMHAAGHRFPGHTEIFAERMGAERSCMLQVSDEITCSFVTTHVGYREVPDLLTTQRILDVMDLTRDAMKRIRNPTRGPNGEPRLVVCGLNPHAGEHGLFGNCEEEQIIEPAIQAAKAKGYSVEGPLPPDTAFLPWKRKTTDAFICMYHDQGHIPLKALAFDCAVNTTLGLPVLRTSVDHGTAFDIAWKGLANPNSLFEAVRLAVRLTSATD